MKRRRDTYHDYVTDAEARDGLESVLVVNRRKDALKERSGFNNVENAYYERVYEINTQTKHMRVSFDSEAWTGDVEHQIARVRAVKDLLIRFVIWLWPKA